MSDPACVAAPSRSIHAFQRLAWLLGEGTQIFCSDFNADRVESPRSDGFHRHIMSPRRTEALPPCHGLVAPQVEEHGFCMTGRLVFYQASPEYSSALVFEVVRA